MENVLHYVGTRKLAIFNKTNGVATQTHGKQEETCDNWEKTNQWYNIKPIIYIFTYTDVLINKY